MIKRSIEFCFLFTVLLLISLQAQAADIVFIGDPVIRHSCSNLEKVFTDKLSVDERVEYMCVIAKDEDGYSWVSRGGKRLVYHLSGAYHIFTNPDGSGYIKIAGQYFWDEKNKTNNYQYFESMSQGLQTVTYWGVSGKFSEKKVME